MAVQTNIRPHRSRTYVKKRKWQTHSRCPLCNKDNEKTSHVLRCQNIDSIANYKISLDTVLKPTLESTNTSPSLSKAILKILLKWKEGKKITPTDHPEIFGIRDAIKDQNNGLGWNNFVLGRWSPKCQLAQQQFYTRTRSKITSKRWAAAIIHKLLLTVWDQWTFRNKVAHSDEGPMAIALHRKLNAAILEELGDDNKHILQQDKYLFLNYTYLRLQASPRQEKQQWLKSVDLARKAVHFVATPFPHIAAMQTSMQNYLN